MADSIPKHVAGIDAIRLMAAMLVMMFHYGYWVGMDTAGHSAMASQFLVSFPEFYRYSEFGWVGVHIFFVISGFVIAYSAEKATAYSFFVARVVRLLPAVLICATITLLAAYYVHYQSYLDLTMAYLHSIFFLPQGPYVDDSYWTLAIEVVFYSLIFLLLAMGCYRWIRQLAIAVGLASGIFQICSWITPAYPDSVLNHIMQHVYGKRMADLTLLNYGCFFALGVFLWLQFLKKSPPAANLFWMLIFTDIGCLQIYITHSGFVGKYIQFQPALVPILIWLAALALIVISIKCNAHIHRGPAWLASTLRRMGLMTYPLYLIHQMAGMMLLGTLIQSGVAPYTALITTVACVFIAAWFISSHLEPPLSVWVRKRIHSIKDMLQARLQA